MRSLAAAFGAAVALAAGIVYTLPSIFLVLVGVFFVMFIGDADDKDKEDKDT